MSSRRVIVLVVALALVALDVPYLAAAEMDCPGHPRVTIISRGATLYCPASLRVTDSGDLWVVDGFGSNFLRMNRRNGRILEKIPGAMGSAALEVDNNGNIYWLASFIGEIYKRSPDGQVTLLAELNSHVDGLELSPDEGRLFVSSLMEVNALWEVDPDGIDPPVKIADVGGLDQFAFGPDGYLYAPDWFAGTGNILKINVDTGEIEVFTGGFTNPSALRFSPDDEMHVYDFALNQILKVDMQTKEKTIAVQLDPGTDDFAFSPEGEIFIANMEDGFVGKIMRNGRTHKLTRPGLSNPGGISVRLNSSGEEELFVGDGWTVRRFAARSGQLLETYYTTLNPMDIFGPFSLHDDGTNLVTTNVLFNTVQVWSPDAKATTKFYQDFAVPTNAITFQGELVVAQLATGDVVRESDRSPVISGLSVPVGLAADGDDLWVGDWATGCIWHAVADGVVLDDPQQLACGLDKPEGITIDLDGNLLVVETGAGRVSKINRYSGEVSVIAEGLALGLIAEGSPPPTWVAISSVAVSSTGHLYLPSDVNNVIYKIWR